MIKKLIQQNLKTSEVTAVTLAKNLRVHANPDKAETYKNFFKHARNDIFLGVVAAAIRKIAKDSYDMSLIQIRKLMQSNVHDERALAHAILCVKYKKSDDTTKEKIFDFYLKNKKYIRDWSGVDDSAPYIVGVHLLERKKDILYELAISKHLWDRRIAMVSTWWFIRNGKHVDTIRLAKILLLDEEDLIQKATGWMLREVGKRDIALLIKFLDQYYQKMPRTTLRYAIEKLSPKEKKYYMTKTMSSS